MSRSNGVRIGSSQAAVLIAVCSIFTLMTRIPLIRSGHSLSVTLAAAAAAAIIRAVLIIPAVIFFSRHGGGINEAVSGRSKALGVLSSLIYFIFFISAAAYSSEIFTDFIHSRFGENIPQWVIVFLLLSVCVYCAVCGIEGIVRSAAVVLTLFIIMLLVMTAGSADKMSCENVRTAFDAADLGEAVYDNLTAGTELTLIVFLGKFTADKYRCGAYSALAVTLVSTAVIMLCSVLALGDYVYLSDYPFLAIGSAAGVSFLQRTDAVYMIVWVLSAVLFVSAELFCAADCVRGFFPKRKLLSAIIPAALVFAGIMPHMLWDSENKLMGYICSPPVQAVTVFVLPLCALIMERKCGNERKA